MYRYYLKQANDITKPGPIAREHYNKALQYCDLLLQWDKTYSTYKQRVENFLKNDEQIQLLCKNSQKETYESIIKEYLGNTKMVKKGKKLPALLQSRNKNRWEKMFKEHILHK